MKAMLLAALLIVFLVPNAQGFTFYGLEFGRPYPCKGDEKKDPKGYVSCPIELADLKKFAPGETRLIKIDNLAEGLVVQFDGKDKSAVTLQRELDLEYGKGKQAAFSGGTYRNFVWYRDKYLMQLLVTTCEKTATPIEKAPPYSRKQKFLLCLERLTVQSPKLTGLMKKDFVQPPLQK